MSGRIYIWNKFEQFEASCFDKILKPQSKKLAFDTLVKIVNMAVDYEMCPKEESDWMKERVEEILKIFPEYA